MTYAPFFLFAYYGAVADLTVSAIVVVRVCTYHDDRPHYYLQQTKVFAQKAKRHLTSAHQILGGYA